MVADLDILEVDEADECVAPSPPHVDRRPPRRLSRLLAAWRASAGSGLATLALASVALAGCATTGATFRSGVGDALLERPPYYAGAAATTVAAHTGRLGRLPVLYQRGAAQLSIFDPAAGPGTPVGELLGEMNAYLDSLATATGLGVKLAEGGRVSAVTHAATVGPPDVRFGCITETGMPDDECAPRDSRGALGRQGQWMQLSVGRPSRAWTGWMGEVAAGAGVERVLVVTLEIGQYLPRQVGVRGDKVVELGTGYVQALPWLTSLETPVQVLQLTGALVDRQGQAVRIGAEGIAARRTRLLVSAVGGQELLGDADVASVRALRRDDLPGRPLAWRAALAQLVAGITGRTEVARAAVAAGR
jgi:hypothetical protein